MCCKQKNPRGIQFYLQTNISMIKLPQPTQMEHSCDGEFVRPLWRKVRTARDSTLANGQAGRPDD